MRPESGLLRIRKLPVGRAWEALREERLMLLQAERARLAVEFKAAKDAARISFGRAEVLEDVPDPLEVVHRNVIANVFVG